MAYDPHRANVSLLVHSDGANNSTSFVDSSLAPKTLTATSPVKISTAQSKFGGSSLLNDTGGRVLAPVHSGFEFGAGDFTIEAWIYRTTSYSAGQYGGIFCQRNANSDYSFFLILAGDGATALAGSIVIGGAAKGAISAMPPINQWCHVALVRSGTTLRCYTDGVGGTPNTAAGGSIDVKNITPAIGQLSLTINDHYFRGHIDELRVTKGVARYTANFTPPSEPFSVKGSLVNGITRKGVPPAPVSRKIFLFGTKDSRKIGEGVSSAVDGSYSIYTDADAGDALMGMSYPDYGNPPKRSTAYALGAKTWKGLPAPYGHWYEVETAGTTGASEPSWPTNGSTVTDGSVVWRDKGVMERPWAEGPYIAQAI